MEQCCRFFKDRCSKIGQFYRDTDFSVPAGGKTHTFQKFLDGIISIGQNIAFSGTAFFRCFQTTAGHIAHVHKIISAGDAGRKSSVQIFLNQLNHVIAARIIWSDDAGRVYDDSIQTVLCSIKHNPGSFGLCLGISSFYEIRIRKRKFPQSLTGNPLPE